MTSNRNRDVPGLWTPIFLIYPSHRGGDAPPVQGLFMPWLRIHGCCGEWHLHPDPGNRYTDQGERYLCNSCHYSLEARPHNHGYGKHISEDTKKESMVGRVKISLRKTAEFQQRRCSLHVILFTMNSMCTLTALRGTGHC